MWKSVFRGIAPHVPEFTVDNDSTFCAGIYLFAVREFD